MRVAFITVGDTTRRTGGYLYHAEVFRRLRAFGAETTEISASAADIAAQQAAQSALGATFDPRDFDVIVVDALARVVCAPWLARWQAARPLVAMVHELPSVAGSADMATEAGLLHADLLLAVSQHGRAILEERGAPTERIRVVSPGCDRLITDDRRPTTDKQRPTLDNQPSIVHRPSSVVLCVAQWIPRKGILDLVQAWASRPRPGAVLELVGETDADPDYAATVRAAIAAAPPTAPITVRGVVSDEELEHAYRAATLFALPSRYEGYGMAYAEALRHCLPVIACAVGPVPELVGAAGLLVPPGDVGALAAALDWLLGNAALRHELGTAARRQAATLPTWDDTARRFYAALQSVLAHRTP
jgi:glycosyltransferase involved in cell wall biosynthesis